MSAINQLRETWLTEVESANLVASRKVKVQAHAGKFTFDELARKSHACPAVFITVLGFNQLSDSEKPKYAYVDSSGGPLYKVRLAMGVVAKNARSAMARNLEAEAISAQLSALIDDNDLNQDHVSEAHNIKAEGLFLPQAEKAGLSLWVVGFEQVAALGVFDAASLADFEVVYAQAMENDALLVDSYQELHPQDIENALITEDNDYHVEQDGHYQVSEP